MNTRKNLVNSVDAKSSAKRGLSFTAKQLKQWHWNEGMSLSEIGKMHGVSCAAIGYWFQKLHIQHRSNLQEVLFEPSPALSYVIGVILGDGCVYHNKSRNNQWTIRLQVTDRVFAEHFRDAIKLVGINCNVLTVKSHNPKWSDKYLAYSDSRTFGEWWTNTGRIGAAEFAAQFPDSFVRGFYEAEGTIKNHRGRLELSICNTDGSLMKLVRSIIPQSIRCSLLQFGPYKPGTKARWDLCINNQLDIKRFLAWTLPCMKTSPRGHANTEPILDRNIKAGVENTKAIQTGWQVGHRGAILECAAPSTLPSVKMYSDLAGNRKSRVQSTLP